MNEEKKLRLTVASSPHVASPIDTTNLMRDVLIALVPAMVMGLSLIHISEPTRH